MANDCSVYLAVDLGAGSGRVIAGVYEGGTIRLEVVHRFENPAIETEEGLKWGVDKLWEAILTGLKIAASQYDPAQIKGIGVDTWGVDYVLLNNKQELVSTPFHYRDPRTKVAMLEVLDKISKREVFEKTGIQFMPINTLYQLHTEKKEREQFLNQTEMFVLMPDYFNFLLTGKLACEFTNASTTQMLHTSGRWCAEFLQEIGIDSKILPPIIDSGLPLGSIQKEVAEKTGLASETVVYTVGSHDTASAVVGAPAKPDTRFAYLSSGTWSLLGVELQKPIINEQILELNFTNEAGVFGTTRFLKNITGLWLVQECKRIWEEEGRSYSFDELAEMSAKATPRQSFIDPDHPSFAGRGNMPQKIVEYCRNSGQRVPKNEGEILRVINDSLALKCRWVLEKMQSLVGEKIEVIHIIGGGGRETLLNQTIADCTNLKITVGPSEATAYGNVVVQMIARGEIDSINEGRSIIIKSEKLETINPGEGAAWDEAFEVFSDLVFMTVG